MTDGASIILHHLYLSCFIMYRKIVNVYLCVLFEVAFNSLLISHMIDNVLGVNLYCGYKMLDTPSI